MAAGGRSVRSPGVSLIGEFTAIGPLLGGAGIWWTQYGTSVVYVSNVATNGYGLGNDTTGTGSKATPYLTIAKGAAAVLAGGVVAVNPSGTEYAESTSGVGYLNLPNKALAISGDITASGLVTVSGTGATPTRVVGFPTSAFPYTIANLNVDGTGVSGSSIGFGNQTGLVRFSNVKFLNNTGSVASAPTGTGNNISFQNCIFDTTVTTGLSITSAVSYASFSVTGCIFSQSGAAFTFSNGTATNLVCTGNMFNGAGASCKGFTSAGATISNFLFSGNSASGTHGAGPVLSVTASTTISSGDIFNNTGSSSNIYISFISETSVIRVYNNPVSGGGSAGSAAILVKACAQGSYVNNNAVTVTSALPLYGILVGTDGFPTDSSNGTATATQNLGDTSADTYVSQGFKTTTAASNSSHVSELAGVQVTLKKVGTPTGTITAYVYTDNAGVPGTLVATSDTSVAANSPLMTTSAQIFFFTFNSHPTLTPGTAYQFVMKYTGTADGTNYIQASSNATVTNGHAATSADGATWTAEATVGLLYAINTGCFAASSIDVVGNTVTAIGTVNSILHSLIIGAINPGNVKDNVLTGTAGRMVLKDTFGGVVADNLIYNSTNANEALFLKGAVNTKAYQNTIVSASPNASIATVRIGGDNGLGVNYPPSSGYDVQNNIFVNTGGGFVYDLELTSAGLGTIDHNDIYDASGAGIELNTYTTFAAWQAAGYDVHGVNANPLLASSTPTVPAGFVPAHNSPAAGIGANLLATVPTDYNGVAFPNPPPAGALNVAA